MAGRLSDQTTKVHLHLFSEDLDFIDEQMCRQGMRTVGRSKMIRLIVHGWVQHVKRHQNAKPVPFDDSITELISE
jgi:hypothetical protein